MRTAVKFSPAGLFLLVCWLFSTPVAAAERIALPDNSVLFSAPNFFSAPAGFYSGEVEAAGPEKVFYSNSHPLAYAHKFIRIKIPDGREFYTSPDISGAPDGRVWQHPVFPWHKYLAGILCAVAGAAVAWKHVSGRKNGSVAPGSAFDAWCFVLEALCLRFALSFAALSEFSNVIPAAADDNGYFEVGYDLLHRSFSRPWRYTLGNGLLYLPFIALTGATEFYDIAPWVDHFNLLFSAPLILVLSFLILRRLGLSVGAAGWAILLGAVWPFAAVHFEGWDKVSFPAFFMWPVPGAAMGAWRFYRFCIGAGFNAMSDIPGMCVLLLAIYLTLRMRAGGRGAAVAGAVYGFACLMRINYCFLAPLLVFLYWRRTAEEAEASRRGFWIPALSAAAGFMLIFGWQFLINFRDFGSPLRFGYILHYVDFPEGERPADGFTFHTLTQWRNLRFLFEANHAAWTLFFCGVWFLRDRRMRTAFVLWAVPLTVFFLGYQQTYCDSARFILPAFPAFFGAFCALDFKREIPGRGAAAAWAAILATVVLGRLNPRFGVPAAATLAPWLALDVFIAWRLYRDGRRRAAGAVAFAGVYFAFASPFAGGALLLSLLARSAWDIWRLHCSDTVENPVRE